MQHDGLSFLLEPEVARVALDVEVAYLAFGNASLRPRVLEQLRGASARARALADRMLLGTHQDWLPFASATVVATAVAVLALDGKRAAARLAGLVKTGPPSAALHARAALVALGLEKAEAPKQARAALDALGSKGAPQRARGAAALVAIASPAALPGLRRALDDDALVVRVEAARALGALGDGESFARLLARFEARPKVPPASTRGAPPAPIADALAAYDGLVRLGDVRAIPAIVALARDAKYVGWAAKLAEVAPLAALASLQPAGIVGLAERALVDESVVDTPIYAPHMSDAGGVAAAHALLARWAAQGPAAQRARRARVRAGLADAL